MTSSPMDPSPAGQAEPEGGLGRRAARGAAWQGVSYVLGKLVTLLATIVLARLLTPNDFGLVALALVFVTYLEVVIDLGASQALVYLPRERRTTDAAFTLALLWAGVLVVVAVVAAPTVAGFFEEPRVASMFRVLALALIFGAAAQVPDALLRKELRFRRRMIALVSQTFTRGLISVLLAVMGLGPWAIVWGYLGGNVVWSVIAWILSGERPTPRPWRLERAVVRPLLSYGLPAAGNALLLGLIFNIDYLIVGERLGPTPLGLYTIAYRVPEMAVLQALWISSAVAFPVFSQVRGEPERLRRGYLTSVRLQATYGAAMGAGLAASAPLLVPAVFGSQWTGSIVPLQALSIYAAARALGMGPVDLCNGIGRPGLGVGLSLVRLATVVPVLLVATRWGVDGVAWAHAGAGIVLALFMQAVASRLLRIPIPRFAEALVPALVAGLATAGGVLLARLVLPGGDLVRLAGAAVAGAGAGLAGLWLADRTFLVEVAGLLRRRTSSPSATASP